MPAGSPCTFGDLYTAIQSRLSADITLANYAPGGIWAEHPSQGASGPFVRVWVASAKDCPIQDGQMSRAETEFNGVITMLDTDQSPGTAPNFIDGSLFNVMGARSLDIGSKRIYSLLHGFVFVVGGFQVLVQCLGAYLMVDSSDGKYDVMTGWRILARVQ